MTSLPWMLCRKQIRIDKSVSSYTLAGRGVRQSSTSERTGERFVPSDIRETIVIGPSWIYEEAGLLYRKASSDENTEVVIPPGIKVAVL